MKVFSVPELDIAGIRETKAVLDELSTKGQALEKAVAQVAVQLAEARGAYAQAEKDFLRRYPWAEKDCVLDTDAGRITGEGVPADLAVAADA